MQKFFNNATDRNGNALSGATVSVYDSVGALASLYSDDGATAQANPITADANGAYSFYAANGTYSLTVSHSGFATQSLDGILLQDVSGGGGSASVGFLAAGSGAVARTAQSKMREIVSVTDYGATGDGTTDDTAAINLAIVSAISLNAELHFLPGVFKVSSALLFGALKVRGAGTWKTFILQATNTANGVEFDPNYASGGGIEGISIHAVSTNPGQTKSSGIGLKVNRANGNFVARDFDVNGFATGVQSAANFYPFFSDFQILNASTAAIHLAKKPAGAGYQDSAGCFFDTAKMSNFGTASTNTGSVGLLIESASGDHYVGLDATVFNEGVKIAPAAGCFVAHLFFDTVLADTSVTDGWVTDPTNGAITNISCVDCWAGFSTNGNGVNHKGGTNDLDDFKWLGGSVRENGQHGVKWTWGKNIRYTAGVSIARNSKLVSLAYRGVFLANASATANISLLGARVGNFGSTAVNEQIDNVYIDAAVTGSVDVLDCDLSNPGAGGFPVNDQSTAASVRLRGNRPIQSSVDRVGGEVIRGCTNGTVAAGATVYLQPQGSTATEANAYYVPGHKGNVCRVFFAPSAAPGVGQTYTLTLRVNGVDTALVATASGAGGTSAAITGSAAVDINDFVTLKLVTSGGAAVSSFRWSMEISG